jgi:molecular chaperone DnaK (HSP70)
MNTTLNNNEELYLGIDLGTTTNQIAVLDKTGTVKVIPNMDGDITTITLVSVAGKTPVFGRTAKPDKFLNPDMVAELFKRYMHIEPPPILVTSPNGTKFTPVALSAESVHFMKESAEKLLGCKIRKAVIGVPAYFKEPARLATKQAGLIAGFEEVHIVDEPTLAATFYGLAKGKVAKIAVFDFGGGTFDISILDIKEGGQIEPIAVDGDPECGGSNIDEIIFQQVREFVSKKGGEISPEKDLAEWLEVLDRCKDAKEALAHKDATIIPLRIGDERTSMELTYDQLKELCAPIIENLRRCCKRALEKAKLQPCEIDTVVLVGGSTRLRFIPDIVREIFGKDAVTDVDPDFAVAKGAAIVAASYFGKPNREIIVEGKRYLASAVKPQTMIAPRDLCVAVITKEDHGDREEYNVPIIPAGSKLSYTATEFFTPIDAKTNRVHVKLYDGHAGELSKNCTPIQEAEVEVQPTDEESNRDRIEFKISMDAEGLVHIEVRDKLLNRPVPIKFKFHTGLSDSDVEEARKQLLARHSTSGN